MVLFDRDRRTVVLTTAGAALVPDVRALLEQADVLRLCAACEARMAVLAAAEAISRDVGELGLNRTGVWLPADDPHRVRGSE